MTTIERLRELEKAANRPGVSTIASALAAREYDNAVKNALPAALAVIEAAEAMEEHRDFFCECDLLPNGHKCPVCTVLAALAAFREVKL